MIKKYRLTLAMLLASAPALAMQALDESQLGDVSGAGLGAVFDNMVIDSADYGQPGAFTIKLSLTEDGPEAIVLSELRFHKSVNDGGGRGVGGFFGSYDDPFVQNQVKDIIDYKGDYHTALVSGWPAAHLQQKERSFFNWAARDWNGKRYGSSIVTGNNIGGIGDYGKHGSNYYRGLPEGFFTGTQSINVGNLYSQAQNYQAYLDDFDTQLDKAANKFDLHFRIDAITAANADKTGINDHFLAYADAIGARFYGTENAMWSTSQRGLSMSMTLGLNIDELRLTTSPDGAIGSQLSLKGVDIYLPQGSVDQPMTISTVRYNQVVRGQWKTQTKETDGSGNPLYRTQMRMEIAALPNNINAVQRMKKGHIFVQSLSFGNDNDPEVVTGVEDIFLRDASGNIIKTVNDVKHRAFVPKTVIYNEQIDLYNAQNPNNKLPNIPNQNVIEVRGLEIQRMVMTTQDLGR